MDRKKVLISILLDKHEEPGLRHDAVMELAQYDDENVVAALLEKAKEVDDDELVVSQCGEALAEIWLRQNKFNYDEYQKLSLDGRNGVYIYLRVTHPEWIKLYCLNEG